MALCFSCAFGGHAVLDAALAGDRWEVDGLVVGYGLSVQTLFKTPGEYQVQKRFGR